MKVAFLISGYLRSFEYNLENIKNKIINNFESVDVYLHITEKENTEDKYLNFNQKKTIEKIIEELKPKSIIIESNITFSENEKINSLFNQWVKFYKLNNLKKIHEKIYGKYDLVVKSRPDLFFISDINFEQKNNTISIPKDSKIDKNKLLNFSDDFIADTFAFGDSKSMDLYFDIYENLKWLIDNYGFIPETILCKYLKSKIEICEIDIDYYIILSKCNIFAICGDSGSGKTTLGNLLKNYFNSSFLLECDRYHKWERNNENWKVITHLNPEGNFITKMNQDIFNLKIGKTIHQVNYDHSTGKFTQKEKIENSENLIVCGLHSLYNEEQNLYDLKIFMDTEESLKIKWKIKRDVEKRNYTEEKILKQIQDRKNDFEKYILPQKYNSDIIVNFYELNGNISLKVKLHKNLNNEKILDLIHSNFNNYTISFEMKYIVFDFSLYEDISILNNLSFRSFDYYDYIIFILLNL
jgi:uridine kinase